jgi:hypothetical protein
VVQPAWNLLNQRNNLHVIQFHKPACVGAMTCAPFTMSRRSLLKAQEVAQDVVVSKGKTSLEKTLARCLLCRPAPGVLPPNLLQEMNFKVSSAGKGGGG